MLCRLVVVCRSNLCALRRRRTPTPLPSSYSDAAAILVDNAAAENLATTPGCRADHRSNESQHLPNCPSTVRRKRPVQTNNTTPIARVGSTTMSSGDEKLALRDGKGLCVQRAHCLGLERSKLAGPTFQALGNRPTCCCLCAGFRCVIYI